MTLGTVCFFILDTWQKCTFLGRNVELFGCAGVPFPYVYRETHSI